ncbi:MAG: hypothetical protein GY870_13530 [archaeon]|nr:hypothetical protein [archaeon]
MTFKIWVEEDRNIMCMKIDGKMKKLEQIKCFTGMKKADKKLSPNAGFFIDISKFQGGEQKDIDYSTFLKNVKYTAILKGGAKETNIEVWEQSKGSDNPIRFFLIEENAFKWLENKISRSIPA